MNRKDVLHYTALRYIEVLRHTTYHATLASLNRAHSLTVTLTNTHESTSDLSLRQLFVCYPPRHAHGHSYDHAHEEEEGRLRHRVVPQHLLERRKKNGR